jgi:chromosome segregation ATPase
METAKKILAKVGNVRHEQPDNPVPPPSPVDFLGLHKGDLRGLSLLQLETDPKMKALNFLRQRAEVLKSKEMQRLAQQVKAHLGGPFTEVNDMIMKMIFRLEAEQKDEDIHKNWCDNELDKTQDTIDAKTDKIENLETTVEEDEARVQELTNELTDASEMVAEIVQFMKDATETREIGKSENEKAIKDAQAAQKAISQAIQVLEDHYKESGEVPKEPYEFVQRGTDSKSKGVDLPEQPEMWDASYTGVSDPKSQPGGIVTVLEESSADFAKMEAETTAEEAEDQKQYQEDMSTHRIEKSKRDKEIQAKTEEKQSTVANVAAMKKMLGSTKAEKAAAKKYEKELQPACVDGDSTYEDRKEARQSEIEGLREARDKIKDAFKEDESLVATHAKVSFLQRHD